MPVRPVRTVEVRAGQAHRAGREGVVVPVRPLQERIRHVVQVQEALSGARAACDRLPPQPAAIRAGPGVREEVDSRANLPGGCISRRPCGCTRSGIGRRKEKEKTNVYYDGCI